MTREEKIALLTDNTKTDKEVSEILGVCRDYVRTLRRRWNLPRKKRGNKTDSIKTAVLSFCKVCGISIRVRPSYSRIYCSRDCQYKCSEYREKLSSVDRSYLEKCRRARSNPLTPAYKKYAGRVHRLSHKIYLENVEMLNPEGHPRTLCGVDGGYQLDHVVSVRHGYENDIPPEEISQLDNLRIIPWKQNLLKGK